MKWMDRETVITHLQIIHTWAEFSRERDLQFFTAKHLEDIAQWSDEAIVLLKEQKDEIDDLMKMLKYPELHKLVKCRDCKHWEQNSDVPTIGNCPLLDQNILADWFCGDGERRDS